MSLNYPTPRHSLISYRVAFANDTSFTREQREWIGLGVFSWHTLGVEFLWHADPSESDVLFTHWADDNSTEPVSASAAESPEGSCKNAGRFTRRSHPLYSDVIELDPVGLVGELQWIEAAAHECGHFLGLEHLTGRVPAVMAPTLAGSDEWNAIDSAEQMTSQGTLRGLTNADAAEFDRVVALGLLPVPRK